MAYYFKSSVIRNVYRYILRPIYFSIDPEFLHNRFVHIGLALGTFTPTRAFIRWLFHFQHPALQQRIAGIDFPNPIGLAAGFDKDGKLLDILEHVGFGFEEVGSITLKPYEGNPGTRLYRLPKSKGIVVNYGLKNDGVDIIVERLKRSLSKNFIKGISIAKTNSKETADTTIGIEDYVECLKKVIEKEVGDFYTINISCPNSFGGEPFTTPRELSALLDRLCLLPIKKPLFLKMPSNLAWEEFSKLCDIAVDHNITGVIISNLNKDRSNAAIKEAIPDHIRGSIGGKPVWDISNALISQTHKWYKDKLIIIGVGGIFSAEDAYEKIKRGASLVQLITGMIYEGPQLIGDINRGLVELLKKDGYKNIGEAVGAYQGEKLIKNPY